MKKIIYFAFLTLLVTSCKSLTYYQILSTTPVENVAIVENNLVYENKECKITYDFWSEGGDIGFIFQNKTNEMIYLKLDECFFVLNGMANNYYRNRTFTGSKSTVASFASGLSASTTTSNASFTNENRMAIGNVHGLTSRNESSVTFNEEKMVCIPSNSYKVISEYLISESMYRDCDLLRYPMTKKQTRTLSYTKDNSPIVFGNRIAYTIGKSNEIKHIENNFFVDKITNYPENDVIEQKPAKVCDEMTLLMKRYFKTASPNMFYFQYSKLKNGTELKH